MVAPCHFPVSTAKRIQAAFQKIRAMLASDDMQIYDPTKPLIFSHIPKSAGTSILQLFRTWFGGNLLLHYGPSERHDLATPPDPHRPVALYGHFNRQRGKGIDQCYPEVDQFVTILRDPWERVISGYFYRIQTPDRRQKFPKVAAMDIEEYVENWPFDDPDYGPPSSNFLPRPCDMHNFRDILNTGFIDIGFTKDLPRSMARMAKALGAPFTPDDLPHINTAPRSHPAPEHLKPGFIKRNSLEYAIYDYARERYG